MTRGACCFSAVLVAIAAWTNRVQAAPGGAARLEYARSERAAACPDRGALKAAVSKRLGYDPFLPAARQTIVVEIIDVDGGLRAQMRLSDENGLIIGSRELREQAGHCDELVASLALAIGREAASITGAIRSMRSVRARETTTVSALPTSMMPKERRIRRTKANL